MCKAFSCVIERTGKVYWKLGMDSHLEIVEMSGLDDLEADRYKMPFARVEITPRNGDYRHPDEWVLTIDEQATPTWWSPTHDVKCRRAHEQWCEQLYKILDCDTVIKHPFRDITPPAKITQEHIDLLHQWDSARNSVMVSVGASVGASVMTSVRASVGVSVMDSVRDSVGPSVKNGIRASVMDSVGVSVWASVMVSVRADVRNGVRPSVGVSVRNGVMDSVWAQIGSLFRIDRSAWKYTESLPLDPVYPFQAAVDLWNLGLVPSFDGKTWRLYGGPDGRTIYEEGIWR